MPRAAFAPTRRTVLKGGGAMLATSLFGCDLSPAARSASSGRLAELRLTGDGVMLDAGERPLRLAANGGMTPTWLYGDAAFPVLRARQGEAVNSVLMNRLKEHSSIHWHGVRVPNAMDGVPYVTQMPVQPGESFTYSFAPPDAGTFFFHPHCNTIEQLGRGLAGVLVVEGEDDKSVDDDIVLVLKDWRLAEDGSFLPFLTLEGAGRSGSYGTLRTVNGFVAPEIAVPAGANVRLRLVNADSTRVADIGVDGTKPAVIAIDGNAVAPFVLENWRLGPAMRLDLTLRTPEAGGKLKLVDYFAADPVTLATFTSSGAAKRGDSFSPAALAPPKLPEPELANAQTHQLRLSATAVASDYANLPPIVLPDGRRIDVLDSLCSTSRTLWAVDGKTWPQSGHEHLPPPLLELRRGETARVEFVNTTPHIHPMHLHGHSFKVLSASKLERPVHWADTVLVMPEERVEIAFVADNPGNWMLHCHIIEHQDTGMMGWFRVA